MDECKPLDMGPADLKVRIQLNNTSAAVVERTIPSLPIDVSAGRLAGAPHSSPSHLNLSWFRNWNPATTQRIPQKCSR